MSWFDDGFAALTPDINGIYSSSYSYAMDNWRALQTSLVTGSGALASSVPGVHLAGMTAEAGFLMNRMAVCSYGIGGILGYDAGLGNILEDEDFAIVLGRWSGDDSVSNAAVAKIAGSMSVQLTGTALAKSLAKISAQHAGILVGKKLAGKAGAKIGGKFAAKFGTKAAGGFIPFVGPLIGGGVNAWFITSIANAADGWYRLKIELSS